VADAVLEAIPEPPAWTVLGFALCILGMLRWRNPWRYSITSPYSRSTSAIWPKRTFRNPDGILTNGQITPRWRKQDSNPLGPPVNSLCEYAWKDPV